MREQNRPPSGNAGVPDLSYYDLALALVPIPLLVGFLAGTLLAVPTQVGVSAGAVLSALVVAHLLFGDPPTRRGPRGEGGSTNYRREFTERSA